MLRVLLSSNEPRARHLFARLEQRCTVIGHADFDQIDPLTRYGAAALSFRRPRAAWWRAYQMHPLLQARRRRVLQAALRRRREPVDALLMWGSWFHPTAGGAAVPFFQYIDQSLAAPAADADRVERESFRLQAATYADCAGILCMSKWARDETLAAHPGTAGRLHVVGWGPCGVDLSDEVIPEEGRRPMVLHVSNDFTRKGVDFLIRTAELVRRERPAAEFVVVGQDDRFAAGEVGEGVRFVGRRTGDELAACFREASVFLLPHRFDRSPHVLVEAMSAGLPIVASAQGGAVELVEGAETGWLVPVGDVEGYARAVSRLLGEPALRARMGEAARQRMRRDYTWDRVAENIVRIMTPRLAPA